MVPLLTAAKLGVSGFCDKTQKFERVKSPDVWVSGGSCGFVPALVLARPLVLPPGLVRGGALDSSNVNEEQTAKELTGRPPRPVFLGGIIALIQSVIGLGFAAVYLVRQMVGVEDETLVYLTDNAHTAVGLGNAIFLIIIFGAVATGAIFMMRGRRWGRGPVVMLEIMLLLISYYIFKGGLFFIGAATALSALISLGALFSPASVEWAARRYAQR